MRELDTLVASVEGALDSPEFRARLFTVLQKAGLYKPTRSAIIHYRTQTADRLLVLEGCRANAVRALQRRFGIGPATAYRYVNRAICMRFNEGRRL